MLLAIEGGHDGGAERGAGDAELPERVPPRLPQRPPLAAGPALGAALHDQLLADRNRRLIRARLNASRGSVDATASWFQNRSRGTSRPTRDSLSPRAGFACARTWPGVREIFPSCRTGKRSLCRRQDREPRRLRRGSTPASPSSHDPAGRTAERTQGRRARPSDLRRPRESPDGTPTMKTMRLRRPWVLQREHVALVLQG